MAVTELDSFVSKFKSLLASGQEASLTFNSKKGKVWVQLEVGLQCPQPHLGAHHGHGLGNARDRHKIRRAADRAKKVTEDVKEVANVEDQVDEETTGDTAKDAQVDVTGSSAQEVATNKEHHANDASEMRKLEFESKSETLGRKT
jgi:hypothetical protein